jgi:hypothetical protein
MPQALPRISHWIDGTLSEGTSGRTGPVFNPATGSQAAEVRLASLAEVIQRRPEPRGSADFRQYSHDFGAHHV